MKRMRNLKGFTLIELIVVILILGILAAIAVVGYTQITDRANETAGLANAKQVATALSADTTLATAATVNVFLSDPSTLFGPDGIASSDDYINIEGYLNATYPSVALDYDSTGKTVTVEGKGSAADLVIDVSGPIAVVK